MGTEGQIGLLGGEGRPEWVARWEGRAEWVAKRGGKGRRMGF